jgi:hypothetical protein
MTNVKILDITAGLDFFSDAESFLDQLNHEESNLIYGGKINGGGNLLDKCPTGIAIGTALTARPVCITNPGGLDFPEKPIHDPHLLFPVAAIPKKLGNYPI